ncbi:MAG: chitobiase/beta-hexosaminidase C-terminal domain-containing protein, partial [Prevotella sp.]|nr:chitobiase/beta-hexosaminidase C-terminal domain-containing protein [Prevotella sp.]
ENTAVAVAQQGKNLWIKDNSGWMLVFGDLGGVTYNNGDVIPALYGGCRSANYGLPELADPIRGFDKTKETETVDAVQPQKIAANALASTPLNSYVELRGKVTLDEGKTRNYTLTDDTGTAAIYTSSKDITVTTGEKVVVRGFVSIYMKDSKKTYQITPVESFEDRTPAAPTFGVAGGIVAKGTEVALTGPEGATVKYQIDGESEAYTEYTEPIAINKNTTLRAIAELDGILSDAVAMKYQVRVSSAPVITPASGEIAAGTSLIVNLPEDAPEGAAVFVKRIDDEGFWQYINTQPITIDAATTVTAVVAMPSVTSAGMDETDFIRSEEATATYTIATEPEPEDKIYMLGNIPGVGWDPSSNKAPLVKNNDGKYVIEEVTISDNNQGYGYFCFVDQLGANGDDWSVNNGHRYGPEIADTEVTVGQATEMRKSDTSWKIPAGTYKMVVDIDAMTFVATAVTPTVVYPEKMYIFSNVSTNGGFKAGTGIEMTKVEDGIFRIDHVTVDEAGLILFSSDNTGDYYKYAYGATDKNDIYITNLPATKTLAKQDLSDPNIFKTAPGRYNIVVNLIDNTMYIEEMTWPDKVYVLGNISKHHWKPDYTGAKMIMENDGKYHINGVKFELSGREEVAYFCLSTKASTVWDEVNANQYGAVAGNTAIDNEVETQVMKGINNWTAAPGTYDITFDFENMKITVKANSETNTIYYKPAEGETMVYMYAYKTSTPYTRAATGPVNAIWPGEPISVEESIDNTGYIRCEVSN